MLFFPVLLLHSGGSTELLYDLHPDLKRNSSAYSLETTTKLLEESYCHLFTEAEMNKIEIFVQSDLGRKFIRNYHSLNDMTRDNIAWEIENNLQYEKDHLGLKDRILNNISRIKKLYKYDMIEMESELQVLINSGKNDATAARELEKKIRERKKTYKIRRVQ